MADIVKLDVGGTIFKTTKSTLTKFDGFFKTLLETGIPVLKDESGAVFIDRSPKHFDSILNFMRDGDVELPESEKELKGVQKEAEYYCLDRLVELCKKSQKPVELEYPGKLRYIKSDEELHDLTYKPKKPVIVFFGPIQAWGAISYSDDFNLLEVQKKHASQIDFYIRLFTASDKCDLWYYRGYANGKIFAGGKSHSYMNAVSNIKDLEDAVQQMVSQ